MLKRAAGMVPASIYSRLRTYSLIGHQFREIKSIPEIRSIPELRQSFMQTHIGANTPLLLLEFGSYRGESMRSFASNNRHPDSRFFGFDSFQGLPENWVNGFDKGAFDVKGHVPLIEDARVTFIKGWFSDTLPEFISMHPSLANKPLTKLVHFDADLYSSTLFVITQLWPKLTDFYFIFDEFTGDEARALADFLAAYPVRVQFLSKVMAGHFPECVSGRITTLPSVRA